MKQITRCFECGKRIMPKELSKNYAKYRWAWIIRFSHLEKYGTHENCGGYEIKSKPRYINKSIYV